MNVLRIACSSLLALLAIGTAQGVEDVQSGAAGTSTTPGGAASALASSGDPSNTATARGGSSLLTFALAGGQATANAATSNSTPGISTTTTARASGGNSGRADATTRPEAGSATAAAVVTDGAANQSITLSASATGGSAGGASFGHTVSGNSGSASASVLGGAVGATLMQGTASAIGGTSFGSFSPPAGGGNGGYAYATGRLENPMGARTVLTVLATGGNGGDWNGTSGENPFPWRAGEAGGAGVGEAFASAAGSVLVDVTARGGNGGLGFRATATVGASVDLDNAVNGTAGDEVEFRQTAIAGNGGSANGTSGAAGGNASSRIDRTVATRSLIGRTSATGGQGGGTSFVGGTSFAGNGGSATAATRLANPLGSVQAFSQATTAVVPSSGGATGDAAASAEASSGAPVGGLGATAEATATGGFGGGFGRGGGALASALAQSAGGTTTATASATGGAGQTGSNTVSANASASNSGTGGAAAAASAFGAQTGGTVDSTATAAAAGFVVGAVRAGTRSGSSYAAGVSHEARARLGVAATAAPSSQVWGSALGAPSAANLATAFANAPGAASRFDLSNVNQRLLLATFSAAPPAAVGTATVRLGLTVDLANLALAERGHLQLALLGGSGSFTSLHFQVLRDSVTSVDVTFTTAAEANAYFADRVLDLGGLSTVATGSVNVDLVLDLTGGSYAGTMFVGNAPIPEPATWLLLGVGFAGWRLMQRRRA